MNDAADFLRMLFMQDIQRIFCRISGMNDNRKPDLSGKFQLPHKPVFLQIRRRFRPVVVQADFTDGDDFFRVRVRPQPVDVFFRHIGNLARMKSNRPVHERILLHERKRLPAAFPIAGNIDDAADVFVLHVREQFVPVLIKSLIIIMRVCFKKHICLPKFLPLFFTTSHF